MLLRLPATAEAPRPSGPHAAFGPCARALLLAATLASPAALSGCSEPAHEDLDWLNSVYPVADPSLTGTPPDAPFVPGQRRDVGDAAAEFTQSAPNAFAEGVAMPGDLDGDGLGDLLIWSRRAAPPDVVPCREGCPGFEQLEVNVIYGSATLGGSTRRLEPAARIVSWYVHDLRYAVDPAGDVNGDGRADFVIGLGTYGDEQGSAFVVHGGPRLAGEIDVRDAGALLRELGNGTHYGEIAGLGDIDGDGLDDFAIGALRGAVDVEGASGRLYLHYGRTGTPPERRSEIDADASLTASAGIELFGKASSVGDVDGDGLADFVVRDSEPTVYGEGTRAWWLVRGRATRWSGAHDVATVGIRIDARSVRGLGDLDGDGRDELGVTLEDDELREVFVIAGREEWPTSLGLEHASARIEGVGSVRGLLPPSLFPAGDVDGDGNADLLYGDPFYTSDGADAPRGAVYLFRGPHALDGGALALADATAFLGQDWRAVPDPARRRGYDQLGDALAAGSDLNGDGIGDLALAGLDAPDGGRVYLWLGRESE